MASLFLILPFLLHVGCLSCELFDPFPPVLHCALWPKHAVPSSLCCSLCCARRATLPPLPFARRAQRSSQAPFLGTATCTCCLAQSRSVPGHIPGTLFAPQAQGKHNSKGLLFYFYFSVIISLLKKGRNDR